MTEPGSILEPNTRLTTPNFPLMPDESPELFEAVRSQYMSTLRPANAAGYLFAIAKNHAFVDGNKRTAWVTCNIFIEINGGELVFDKLEAVRFVEGVAGVGIDYDGARDWIAVRLS